MLLTDSIRTNRVIKHILIKLRRNNPELKIKALKKALKNAGFYKSFDFHYFNSKKYAAVIKDFFIHTGIFFKTVLNFRRMYGIMMFSK